MSSETNKKFMVNLEMLGGIEIGDSHSEFETLTGGTSGATATSLTSGINNSNLVSAINSAFANTGTPVTPEGARYSIQSNNPDGTFSGSASFLMTPILAGAADAISINNAASTFSNAGVSTLSGLVTATAGVSVPESQGLSGLGNLAISVATGAYDINMMMGDAAGTQRVVFRDSAAAKQATISSDGDLFMSGTLNAGGAVQLASTLLVTGSSRMIDAVTLGDTLAVTGISTFTADLVLNGGDITNATVGTANNVFATSTGKTTLGGGAVDLGAASSDTAVKGGLSVAQASAFTGISTFTADLVLNGGDITNGTTGTANNVFATSTGKTTLGGGAVDLGAAGSATTVKGTLNVDQAVTLDTTLGVTGISTLGAMTVSAAGAVASATTIAASGLISTTSTSGISIGGTSAAGAAADYALTVVGGLLVINETVR